MSEYLPVLRRHNLPVECDSDTIRELADVAHVQSAITKQSTGVIAWFSYRPEDRGIVIEQKISIRRGWFRKTTLKARTSVRTW